MNPNSKGKGRSVGPDRFLFIIGAMKSGTTSLFEILGQHPEISPSKEKEPDFFCKDRDDDTESYARLWDWNPNKHVYAMEASVAYSKAPNISGVPGRIHRSGASNKKFIYVVRNPLSRIESQVRHGIFAGWGGSLDDGIPDDALNFSRYSMQLGEYLKYFPRKSILVVILEEFKDDPHNVLKRICEFLDIDSRFVFSDVSEARNSGDFFNTTDAVAKATQNRFGQFVARRLLSRGLKSKLRSFISRFSHKDTDQSGRGRYKLTVDEQKIVIDLLEPDLRCLTDEYGIDIRKYWSINL